MIHLHEPLAPGPTMTALLVHRRPTVGTFHAAGASSGYRLLQPALRRLARPARPARSWCRRTPGISSAGTSAATTSAVQRRRDRCDPRRRRADARRDGRPTIFFCGRHEQRKGLAVLLEAMRSARRPTCACGSAERRSGHRRCSRPRTPTTRGSSWLGRVSEDEKFAPPAGARRVLRAVARRRVVRRRADRGDGRRGDRRGQRARRLSQRGHRRCRRRAGRTGRRRRCSPAALERVIRRRGVAGSLRAAGTSRAEEFSMVRLAERYLEIYEMIRR